MVGLGDIEFVTLHELFIAIIAILHAKIDAPSYCVKSLQCQYECLFSWHNVFREPDFRPDSWTELEIAFKH